MSFSDILEYTVTNARHDNENNMCSDCKTSEKLEASVQHSSAFTPTKSSGCKSVKQSVTSLVLDWLLISNTLTQPNLLLYTSSHLQCTGTFATNCRKHIWRFQFYCFSKCVRVLLDRLSKLENHLPYAQTFFVFVDSKTSVPPSKSNSALAGPWI
jgi:hypothetical protein